MMILGFRGLSPEIDADVNTTALTFEFEAALRGLFSRPKRALCDVISARY